MGYLVLVLNCKCMIDVLLQFFFTVPMFFKYTVIIKSRHTNTDTHMYISEVKYINNIVGYNM